MFNCGMVALLYWANHIYPNLLLAAFFFGTSLYLISRLSREIMVSLRMPFSFVLPPTLLIGWLISSAFSPYIESRVQVEYAQFGSLLLAFLVAYKTKAWLDFKRKQAQDE